MAESGGAGVARHHTYSRKQKSLGLLCSNFLSLYNRDGIQSIGLDDAASKLGVERRRIYDIVNVLESVGVLARKGKNQYSWKGFDAIPKALDDLKAEGFRENNSPMFDGNSSTQGSDDEEESGSQADRINISSQKSNWSSKDTRREKSLGLLTQNFVKLFVCSNVELISLDEAAKILLGDGHHLSIMRTKVRRLYDIANVLSSMNLIEKTHHTDSRKPAFRWLGVGGNPRNDSANSPSFGDSRKRVFGTEITNIDFKRNKVDSSVQGDFGPSMQMKKQHPLQMKVENLDYDLEGCNQENDLRQNTRSYHFGPFAPVTVAKVVSSEENEKRVYDWESLASTYTPRYQNQALKDLFGHYFEAWKSWFSEVAGKTVQQIS